MSVRVKCPSCDESFNLVDTLVGRRVKCRHCQQPFVAAAEAPDDAELGAAIQDQPRRVAARTRRDDDADSPRRRDDERDDDRPRRRDRDDDGQPRGTPWGWIVGGGIAAVFVVGLIAVLGVVAIVLFFGGIAAVAPKQQGAIVAIADNPDQGRVAQIDLPKDPVRAQKRTAAAERSSNKGPIQGILSKIPSRRTLKTSPGPMPPIQARRSRRRPRRENSLASSATRKLSSQGRPARLSPCRHGQFPNEGWQVFDMEKCKLTGQIQAKIELEKEALSPDGGFLAGKGRGPNFQQSIINVHAVGNGGKIARTFTMDTNAAALRWIDFLEGGHMLTYKTHGITAHFEIWNATGQPVQHFTLQGLLDENQRMCLSPGRKYLAVADDKAIHIFHATEGKKVGMLRPPIGFSAYQGMAFSPDGQELAVYGSTFGASSQLVVYKLDRGELVLHHKFAKDVGTMVKNRFAYKGQPLEWIPDKSGWLMFGQIMIDYASGAPVYDIPWPAQDFSFFPRRFIGPDYVVATTKDLKGADGLPRVAQGYDRQGRATSAWRGRHAAAAELPAAKNGDVAARLCCPIPAAMLAGKSRPIRCGRPRAAWVKSPSSCAARRRTSSRSLPPPTWARQRSSMPSSPIPWPSAANFASIASI